MNKMSLYNYDLYLNSIVYKLYLALTEIQDQSENLALVFQNLQAVLSSGEEMVLKQDQQ